MAARALAFAIVFASSGCAGNPPPPAPPAADDEPFCASAAEPRATGRIESAELDEISGIAASRRQPGVFFVHNDSGDASRFFAVNAAGRTLAEILLPVAKLIDVEDVALARGRGGESQIYLADIGDNAARTGLGSARPFVTVYRAREPDLTATRRAKVELSSVEALTFSYPDRGHDAEVLLVDPVSGDLYIVTKEGDGDSVVFRAMAPLTPGPPRKLEEVGRLVFGRGSLPGNQMATGGDVAPAGDAIVIRTYSSTFVWDRPAGASIAEALRGPPRAIPTPAQPQGEAVTFAADGRGLYTISERPHQELFFVACQ